MNLEVGTSEREFVVWVDPKDFLARHQITPVGSFFSGGSVGAGSSPLMLIPNPSFAGDISPFQNNIVRQYLAEYNLELGRANGFSHYPCRLESIFLFASEQEATKYRNRHGWHVGSRVLKKVQSRGPYRLSTHDSSWVDFLRTGHSMDKNTIHEVARAYWSGRLVSDCELQSMGQPWTEAPIMEVLYLGRVVFVDKTLPAV